ncbi:MAG: hypothetical protein ACXAEU_02555 [Candidatus Hodarchaeales archaeon]
MHKRGMKNGAKFLAIFLTVQSFQQETARSPLPSGRGSLSEKNARKEKGWNPFFASVNGILH